MGSCLCLRKSDFVKENDAVVPTGEGGPFRWAVINPRPSVTALIRQQQDQSEQSALQATISVEISQYPCGKFGSKITQGQDCSRQGLTCLEVLNSLPKQADDGSFAARCVNTQQSQVVGVEQQSRAVTTSGISRVHRKGGSSSFQDLRRISESQRFLGGWESTTNLHEDDPTSTLFAPHLTNSEESTFSHLTAEFEESDESSVAGKTPRRLLPRLRSPLSRRRDEQAYHRSQFNTTKPSDTKTRLINPSYGKISCTQRLSKKYWASEKESLLEKTSYNAVQQRQAFFPKSGII